jgi:hypothetical protein
MTPGWTGMSFEPLGMVFMKTLDPSSRLQRSAAASFGASTTLPPQSNQLMSR